MKDALEYISKKRASERWYQKVEFYVLLTVIGAGALTLLIITILERNGFDFSKF